MMKKIFLIVSAVFMTSMFSFQPIKAEVTNTPSEVQNKVTKQVGQGNKDITSSQDEIPEKLSTTNYGSQYMTSVSFTDITGNGLSKVNDSDKIKVNYNFSIPGDVHDNETMTLQLPQQLQLVNYTDFTITDSSGDVIAIATSDKTTGVITLTFTKVVENKKDITGSLFFWAKFDKNQIVDGENIFPMPLQGVTQDLTLNVHKVVSTGTGTTNPTVIFKNGSFDKKDPTLINWTITINNANQSLLQPKVIDTIGSGQTLVPGSFTFNYRDQDKKSMNKFTLPAGDEATNDRTTLTMTSTGFEAILENLGKHSTINHYSSAVITYQTKVKDNNTRYINNAGTSDELGLPQQRNASVTNYGNGGSASGSTQEAIDDLTNTIDAATSLDPSDLNSEDATQLTEATTNAQNTVDNETSTKKALDDATAQLDAIMDEVTPGTPIDDGRRQALDNLEQLVEKAKRIDSSLYTEKSWEAVDTALKEAEALLNSEKGTPGSTSLEQIQNSTQKLTDVLSALVTKEQEKLENALTDLQHLVHIADAQQEELFTKETWETLLTANQEAKKILATDKTTLTSDDVLLKIDQLQTALDGLEKVISPTPQEHTQETTLNSAQFNYSNTSPLSKSSSNSNLPATGEVSKFNFNIIGFLLLCLASLLLFLTHKNKHALR